MAPRARLSPPREARERWPWHQAKLTSLPASMLMGGERRFEAENYLAGGYGARLSLTANKEGWAPLKDLARIWQPSRLKGIQVSPRYGTPFLAATQVFDLRPIPRKWLSLNRTDDACARFVTPGMILVTCSGSVGRATLAFDPHEGLLISHDLLRVEPRTDWRGWVYAFLRTPTAREMMSAAQYGHIIKHLEVLHLDSIPTPLPKAALRSQFDDAVREVLEHRSRGHALLQEAEALYEREIRPPVSPNKGEHGFSVNASSLWSGRRRLEAFFHNPTVRQIRSSFRAQGIKCMRVRDVGLDVWLPTRFKRITAPMGVSLLDSSDLFEISPDISRTIADGDFGDRNQGRVKAGWLLMARSGQVYGLNGSVAIATGFHEGKVVSDDVIRIAPSEQANIRTGYLYVALSHPALGRPLVKALIYGSSIPHVEVADVENLEIPRLAAAAEIAIADKAEEGARLLAEADILENKLAERAEALVAAFLAGNRGDFVASA